MIAAIALLFALATNPGFTYPPVPVHYVTDNAGALSQGARDRIESELKSFEGATGHQVVVWIAQTTGDVPLEDYTGQTADHWKIGRKGHDDGAVLFAFMKDRKVRIEVGYGLEPKLTDADSSRIINDVILPHMRDGDVDAAIEQGVSSMLATIAPSYKTTALPTPEPEESSSSPASWIVFIIFAVFFTFIAVVIVSKVIGSIRYGYLIMKEGPEKAKADMRRWWFWGGFASGASSGGGWSSFGSGGGGGGFSGFSAGGGGFGGGGASGGW